MSAVRTPVGRYGGSLKDLNSGYLGAIVIEEAIKRAGIQTSQVDEVILGEVRQSTESSNVARVAALRAGVPEATPAYDQSFMCRRLHPQPSKLPSGRPILWLLGVRVNVNGGAIALGHPLGATGAKIMTTLIYELIRRQEKRGIATLCIGGGQGMAIMVERLG